MHDYMGLQADINAKMRSIIVDWLIEVHRKFELMPETLYLTLNNVCLQVNDFVYMLMVFFFIMFV